MRLQLELSREDARRLRRTARMRPTGGYTDLAAVILAASVARADGGAVATLTTWLHIERFARQALTGAGGYQQQLRRLGVVLLLDDGSAVVGWRAAATTVDTIARRLAGQQLELWSATTYAA